MAVVKIIEVMGTSTESWEDAANNALQGAAETVRGITGVEVVSQTAKVEGNQITEFRAAVKVAFTVGTA